MADESKRSAAYLPWLTFKNALDQLAQGVPSRIDRSVFPGIAWNVQTQLFAGMRFLGLLKGEDEPTPALHSLVKGSEEERKEKLKKVIEGCYSELIAIDLTKATRAHFEEKLGELYGVTGDTRVKAVRFFLAAAAYVGIPLSPFIVPKEGKTKGAPRRPRSTTTKAAKKNAGTTSNSTHILDPEKPSGTSKSVALKSGGTLTLSATLDLFALNPTDRKFVFELIDKLEGYDGDAKN
jgi:hypothetical protein